MKTKIEVDQEIDTKIGNKTESKSISNTDVSETLKSINERTENTGTSNPNIFIPTLATDFTSPSAVNANKIWEIQNDITIDANCDFTNCPNIIFTDGGGKIDFGTSDVTFNNTEFRFDTLDIVLDFMTATINAASTFVGGTINIKNFGLVGDGNLAANTGTDNRNIFLQLLKMWNQVHCDVKIKGKGVYSLSVLATAQYVGDTPTNIYFNGTSSLEMDNDVILLVLPNDLVRYDVITFEYAHDTFCKGGTIYGDVANHDYTNGVSEWCNCINIGRASHDVLVTTLPTMVSGDGFLCKNVSQSYFNHAVVEAVFTKGFDIDATTGLAVSSFNGVLNYSSLWDLTDHLDLGNILFNGGSFGGWAGMKTWGYYVTWYDGTASDVDLSVGFLGKSEPLEFHNEVPIPTGATQCRLIITTPDDWTALTASLWSGASPYRITFSPSIITGCVRQAISNPSVGIVIKGIDFRSNGRRPDGTVGNPGAHIDIEDGYEKNHNIDICECTFKDGKAGDILTKACKDLRVFNNDFMANEEISGYVSVNTISLSGGYNTLFYGNKAFDRAITLGRNAKAYDNNLRSCGISLSCENDRFENNTSLINCRIGISGEATNDGKNSFIVNNHFFFDEPLPDYTYIFGSSGAVSGNAVWDDNVYDFNGEAYTNKLSICYTTPTTQFTGYVNKMVIKNLTSSYYKDILQWLNVPFTNSEILFPIQFMYGLATSLEHKNNRFSTVRLDLDDYPSTNAGDFETIKFTDCNIELANSDHVAYTYYQVYSDAKDVNLEFENTIFNLNAKPATSSYGDHFFDLNHYGITLIKDCKFLTIKTTPTLDLTLFTCGVITFIDCDFGGVAVTKRAADVICFTKACEGMITYASYADDAAADLAGYPKGYMYNAAGIPKIKLI